MRQKSLPILWLAFLSTIAQGSECDGVLVQNITAEKAGDAKALASLKLVDEQQFNAIKKERSGATSGGASYKFFKADFDQSNSYSEFEESRNKRLDSYGFKESEQKSRDILRNFLTDKQVDSWVKCRLALSSDGTVILKITNRAPSLKAITLQADVRFPRATPQGLLKLNMVGATINDESAYEVEVQGTQSLPFTVKIDKEADEALITAQIAGSQDALHLTLNENTLKERYTYKSFQFDLCSGHQTNCFGLPSYSHCFFVEVPHIPSGRHVISVDQKTILGQLYVGSARQFKLSTLAPHPNAHNVPAAAPYIKVCGSGVGDPEWRQAVIVNVSYNGESD